MLIGRVRTAVPDADILVADDNSPDGTGALADTIAAEDSHVRVLHRAGKEGLGKAYLAAFAWAAAQDAKYSTVVQMDADGSHRPEDLPRMLDALDAGADLVIGSRWVPGGKVVNWPFRRRLLSTSGSRYARIMLRIPTRDATAGYRVFRTSALQQMPLHTVNSRGYGYQVDMLLKAIDAGLTVVEVPVTFIERELGHSKMSMNIVVEAMLRVTGWGVRRWFRRP